ncbi:MAG: hypothetical protein KDD48_06885 [Bdellovibrionales bacterium]|nr:hypothetical protein [Bdellovibrionales bacterium]
MKDIDYLIVNIAILFSGCSVHHTPATYRQQFGNKMDAIQVKESYSSVVKRLTTLAHKCFSDLHVNYSGGGGSKSVTTYKVKTESTGKQSSVIKIPLQNDSKTWGMSTGGAESYAAIIDIQAVDAKTTKVKPYYRQKFVGKAISMWVKKETDACPEVGLY